MMKHDPPIRVAKVFFRQGSPARQPPLFPSSSSASFDGCGCVDSVENIYEERAERGVRVIDCVFIEHRPIVYELFLKMLEEDALG